MSERLENVAVLVTRPRERSEALCFLLEEEGAHVFALPVLELLPPTQARPLAAAAEQLQRYRWVLFASASAVEALVEAARVAGTLDRLKQARLGTVGPATSRAVQSFGLEVAHEASRSTGEGLFEQVESSLQPGDEVLLPAAEAGRVELFEALRERGVAVTRVAAYRTEAGALDEAVLAAFAAHPGSRAIVFGSPRTAESLVHALGPRANALLCAPSRVVAIGPTTAKALESLGFEPTAVASRPTDRDLVEAVVEAVRGTIH